MDTKVLVVASQTVGSNALLSAMRDRAQQRPTHFTLLLVGGANLPPMMVAAAVERQRAAGLAVELVHGDLDPVLAVQDVWGPASYDEIIVSTLTDQTSRWLRSGLPFRIQHMTGALVRHVVDEDDGWNKTDRAVDATTVKAPAASSLRRRRVLSGA